MTVADEPSLRVTIDEKFRIEIPAPVREALGLEIGSLVSWIRVDGAYELMRVPKIDELRGCLRGLDVSNYREETDKPL